MKKKRKRLSAEEKRDRKIKSDHTKMIRSVFKDAGFLRHSDVADKQFTFKGQMTDFDDIWTFENILVCIEFTTTKSENIGSHLKTKKIVYDKIQSKEADFTDFLCERSSKLSQALLDKYNSDEVVVKIVYCSLKAVENKYKENIPNPIYLDYPDLRYFRNLTDCIKKSARHELFHFMEIPADKVGENGKIGVESALGKYSGSLLPESSSNFDRGFKVVSFYIDPSALLRRAYVLRKDGWRDSYSMYQRMISKTKITSIRNYLKENKRVFVNNIIVTLPEDTKIVDNKNNTVDPGNISKTQPVTIMLPQKVNSIGLIDGQHRTYSYFESTTDDSEIEKLRNKQNLLVTGIIYLEGIKNVEKEKFEARLFLEINSNQTNAKSDLKQAIGLVLNPFSAESIAARVLTDLDKSSGPLGNQVQRYWFDKDKIKTTSIVSYGLKPLVKPNGTDSLFSTWSNKDKNKMLTDENHELLGDYVLHCVSVINGILMAFKANFPAMRWTYQKDVSNRLLTTTNINAFLICLRLLILNNKPVDEAKLTSMLVGVDQFDLDSYHSSQYARMAEAIYLKYT